MQGELFRAETEWLKHAPNREFVDWRREAMRSIGAGLGPPILSRLLSFLRPRRCGEKPRLLGRIGRREREHFGYRREPLLESMGIPVQCGLRFDLKILGQVEA